MSAKNQSSLFMPFTRPSITEREIDAVTEVLKSGWITTGPRVQAFEQALKEYCQAPFASALSSATAGLQLVCASLLQPGDEVITTPLTFIATANSIALAGAKPVFVDIDPENFNLDINKVEAAITNKTKAIMPVHFAGLSVDCDPLYALAEQYNLRVIEDAAHAIGSEYKQRKIGSFGDIQIFSFHPNKNMTSGEGGVVVSRDEALHQQINTLRFHGIDREAWNRFGRSGSQLYDVLTPGYKYNMMDIQAAIGMIQLERLDGFNQQRSHLAERYFGLLAEVSALQLPILPSYNHLHSWHMFNAVIKPEVCGFDRDTFIEKMKAQDVGVGLHYQPVHLFDYYRKQFGYQPGDLPQAERIGDNIVSLPLYADMTEQQQDRIVAAIEAVFSNESVAT